MTKGLYNFILKSADDNFIIGHRNSEWTGIGPFLEEDIAFASMAQDKIGHAWMLYKMLHEQGQAADAETLAFKRNEKEFMSCHFVEQPIGEYDFSLMRHFLFDSAEALRQEMLLTSSFEPLSHFAKKFKGELKYHTMHAETLVVQLIQGNEESKARMQVAFDFALPFALGMFEKYEGEEEIISSNIFEGEVVLKNKWWNAVSKTLGEAGLKMPENISTIEAVNGGRNGYHSEYLSPLLNEMREVLMSDPEATEW